MAVWIDIAGWIDIDCAAVYIGIAGWLNELISLYGLI